MASWNCFAVSVPSKSVSNIRNDSTARQTARQKKPFVRHWMQWGECPDETPRHTSFGASRGLTMAQTTHLFLESHYAAGSAVGSYPGEQVSASIGVRFMGQGAQPACHCALLPTTSGNIAGDHARHDRLKLLVLYLAVSRAVHLGHDAVDFFLWMWKWAGQAQSRALIPSGRSKGKYLSWVPTHRPQCIGQLAA